MLRDPAGASSRNLEHFFDNYEQLVSGKCDSIASVNNFAWWL